MYISVVILSYNSITPLERCLLHLIEALKPLEMANEIFVVDNGSTDGSVELIESFQHKNEHLISTILFNENKGTTYSRNAALRQVKGEYILIIDSDAYVTSQAITSLINYLKHNPETGIAVPRLFYRNGNFQMSCDKFPTLIHKIKRFLFLKKFEKITNYLQSAKAPISVDYAISACWMISQKAFMDTGLFDENIFYSPEDVDYCIRVWEQGYKITYLPDVEVVHDAQELSRGFRLSMFHLHHLKGLVYLMRKHKYFWGLDNLYQRLNRIR
ncbi:glycosyltransferase [Thalassotalea nanhaiensis]|uniref:Glycosyltransferase n=1 Tax=Thalassotalea nanhaiensis TaxID=3065648 RepID=A0ABY9TL22_9GAMM|nr:glycosyltransferase [Colwelliaceae bacterium SQ345]